MAFGKGRVSGLPILSKRGLYFGRFSIGTNSRVS